MISSQLNQTVLKVRALEIALFGLLGVGTKGVRLFLEQKHTGEDFYKRIFFARNTPLNGCEAIKLQLVNMELSQFGIQYDVLHNPSLLDLADVETAKRDLELIIQKDIPNNMHVPIKERKPRYIREQHKLAQRNFRRK